MNPSLPDTITWTIPRAMIAEASISGTLHEAMTAALTTANATLIDQNRQNAALITNLKMQLADALKPDNHVDTLRAEIVTLETSVRMLTQERDAALARIATLVNTPPATVPPVVPGPVTDVKPVISRTELRNVAGVTITKDDTPSTAQDEMTRQLLELSGKTGFNVWRGLMNIEEVKKHVTFPEDDPRNLPAFGRRHGMAFMVDSVDTQAKRVTDNKLNKAGYAEYYAGLKKLGCVGVYMNDVDDVKKAPFIKDWIDLTREAMATAKLDVPLIGSFMATFDRGKYPGFTHYETQCFGTPGELRGFLARHDVDIFCLDGQRSASVAELKVNSAIILTADINNFFIYSAYDGEKSSETDWREMPGEVAEQKAFLMKWRAARQRIVAQEVVEAD